MYTGHNFRLISEHVRAMSDLPAPREMEQKTEELRFIIVSDERAFIELKPSWDELWRRVHEAYFMQTHDWCQVAWDSIGRPNHHKLHCLIGLQRERIVLIWPFEIYRRALWAICRPLGFVTTEYTDVLIEDSPEADRHVAAAVYTLHTSCGSDVISLPYVPEGSRLDRVLSSQPVPAAGNSVALATSAVIWQDWADWPSYLNSRNGANRRETSRRRRRLREKGQLAFSVVEQGEGFQRCLEWIFNQKAASLEKANILSVWHDTGSYCNLLLRVSASRSAAGRMLIFALTLDDVLIAAELVRADKVRLERLVPTFDLAYAQFAPGVLLLEDVLKWAFDRRLDVDFRIGTEKYKENWITHRGAVVSYEISNSLLGRSYFLARRTFYALRV